LTDRLPAGLDKAMFLSTGGESNEAAIKVGLRVSCVSIERAF
jgi:4-aminobutyrate aminotransferase-like enzyme